MTVESDVVSIQLGDSKRLSPQLVDEQVKQCVKELVRSGCESVGVAKHSGWVMSEDKNA